VAGLQFVVFLLLATDTVVSLVSDIKGCPLEHNKQATLIVNAGM
jgi:hypothetical protein